MKYKNIFFDLDDTLWAFSENARDTFEELYLKYGFDDYFDSFGQFYSLYQERNVELWKLYADGAITKQELNEERFYYPLRSVGVSDPELARVYSADFLSIIPTKEKLMPHAVEVLEYLSPRYHLYILSNGFRELQSKKMKASGIGRYFRKVILSEDLGVMKPYPEIFHFALSATQSELKESVMIGDSWEADITGARGVGMHQIYYNVMGRTDLPFKPTHEVGSLLQLKELL